MSPGWTGQRCSRRVRRPRWTLNQQTKVVLYLGPASFSAQHPYDIEDQGPNFSLLSSNTLALLPARFSRASDCAIARDMLRTDKGGRTKCFLRRRFSIQASKRTQAKVILARASELAVPSHKTGRNCFCEVRQDLRTASSPIRMTRQHQCR